MNHQESTIETIETLAGLYGDRIGLALATGWIQRKLPAATGVRRVLARHRAKSTLALWDCS